MSKTSVTVLADQTVAFARLRDHLVESGAIAAAANSTLEAPHLISYSLRLRDGTTQTTRLQLTRVVKGCLLTVSVDLQHEADPGNSGWLTPKELEKQHQALAKSFAGGSQWRLVRA